MCYKCNNLGHTERNCRALENQNETNQRRNAPVCQLCNNFRHTVRYCRMGRRNLNRNPNNRRNNNINDRRNDNSNDNSQKEGIKEHVDEFKEAFVIAKDLKFSYIVLEEKYFDALDKKLKSQIVCDSSYLN